MRGNQTIPWKVEMPPKIAALCPTYNRPRLLGQMIRLFELQDYPNCELIILDDAGQYGPREGDGWRIVSTTKRYPSVGAKRNALVKLTDAEYLAAWDDDDIYLPWALSACAHAMDRGKWIRPSQILEWGGPQSWRRCKTHTDGGDYAYGGAWAYRREFFLATGGYPEHYGNGDDWEWANATIRRFGQSTDTICEEFPDPYYVYSRSHSQSWHAGEMGSNGGHKTIGEMALVDPAELKIGLLEDYLSIPIPERLERRVW